MGQAHVEFQVNELPVLSKLVRRADVAKRRRKKGLSKTAAPPPEVAVFFGRWLRAPNRIGAVAPSSRFLARAMAKQVDIRRPDTVIELGGGTGSVTKALLEVGVPAERLVVVERDERLYHMLRRRFPQLRVVLGDARQLVALLRPLGIGAVSTIVSSLPLVSMPKLVRRQIVEQSFALLDEAGRFVQYTYSLTSPLARRELGLLGRVAERVWLNVPPASVWSFRRAPAIA
jgi:phosphatidylethanolamine/phosphatidyl-N-methylethanolamine N-methyltransferase